MAGRPKKYKTPKELEVVINQYFDDVECETSAWVEDLDKDGNSIYDYVPTISGLAYHLDIATETLRRYENDDEFSATIKKAKQKVEMFLERKLYGQNVTGTIFNLKNNFGWKDKREHDVNAKVDIAVTAIEHRIVKA